MTEDALRDWLDDTAAHALTMWAEARGDASEGDSSVEERIAVGWVIRTRALVSHTTVKAVCLAPWQFSCWNTGADANHRALLAAAGSLYAGVSVDPLLRETLYLAQGILDGHLLDRTHGATHYYAPDAMKPPGRVPSWAKGKVPTARVGRQLFFRL
jgi:N-acetylmuramoyl-L-alanine amidase